MKLIKINTDHYVIVDDTEIKYKDWYLDDTNQIRMCVVLDTDYWKSRKEYKKITHSTQPVDNVNGFPAFIVGGVEDISLQEVKELICEVDVFEKAKEEYPSIIGTTQTGVGYDMNGREKEAYKKGYNQALEDNKDKKYTEEDMLNAAKYGYEFRDTTSFPEHKFEDSCINNTKQWLQWFSEPKTEWEVEIVDGKLKLK